MIIDELKQKALNLPLLPGVYLMYDKNASVIYVGKAKILKNRVKSYFGSMSTHDDKVKKMVSCIDDFDYIITDSEYEALVLECSLIKKYKPKYNILLKDDKGFCYIEITSDKYKNIKISNQKPNNLSTYIGPYMSRTSLNETLIQAKKIFKLPLCKLNFNGTKMRNRPCLNYYLNQCNALCQGNVPPEEHNQSINLAVEFIKSGTREIIKKLNKQMLIASENLQYEKAANLRDKIKTLQKIQDKQKIISSKIKEQDVISFAKDYRHFCFVVLRFLDGKLSYKEEFFIENTPDEAYAYSEFIKRYYFDNGHIPSKIIVSQEIHEQELLEHWLSEKKQKNVKFSIPKKGQQLELLKMCKKNAREIILQKGTLGSKPQKSTLFDLANILHLKKSPKYIEAYDISNIRGQQNVAAMVVFEDAIPNKKAYKRFKIKSVIHQDDYASMVEVIGRRFKEYKSTSNTDKYFKILPDLILIDGGKGHVQLISDFLQKEGISIPVFGMVKDSKHHTKALSSATQNINIKSYPNVFSLIKNIQDEAHRFAINYHKNLRKKDLLKTSLTNIKNIGPIKNRELFKHFKTLTAISDTSISQLREVNFITIKDAENIYHYFHNSTRKPF